MRQEIVGLARRKAAVEVFEIRSDLIQVEFRQGKLYAQETKLSRGWGVRVIHEGRLGFAYSTDPERLPMTVQAALEVARYGQKIRFNFPGPESRQTVNTFDNRVMLISAQRMVEWGRDLVDAFAARCPEAKLDIQFHRMYQEIGVTNTSGIDESFERAVLDVSVTALLVDEGIFWLYEYVNLSSGQEFPLGNVVERLSTLVRLAKRKARVQSGELPVLVMPTALRELLLPLEVAVNGKHREKGTSPLLGQEGKQVLSPKITIADNPLKGFGLSSAPFDGEGVSARRNVLFDKGVFKGFLFDTATAAACGSESTGSAVRGYASLPTPGTTNTEVAPGDGELSAVMREINQGLLIYSFIGGGQSNVLGGDVALNVACGFKIENGQVVGRVKDVSIAGNVYDIFKNVAVVGKEVRDLGNAFFPFVKLSKMKVAARG